MRTHCKNLALAVAVFTLAACNSTEAYYPTPRPILVAESIRSDVESFGRGNPNHTTATYAEGSVNSMDGRAIGVSESYRVESASGTPASGAAKRIGNTQRYRPQHRGHYYRPAPRVRYCYDHRTRRQYRC